MFNIMHHHPIGNAATVSMYHHVTTSSPTLTNHHPSQEQQEVHHSQQYYSSSPPAASHLISIVPSMEQQNIEHQQQQYINHQQYLSEIGVDNKIFLKISSLSNYDSNIIIDNLENMQQSIDKVADKKIYLEIPQKQDSDNNEGDLKVTKDDSDAAKVLEVEQEKEKKAQERRTKRK